MTKVNGHIEAIQESDCNEIVDSVVITMRFPLKDDEVAKEIYNLCLGKASIVQGSE